jgi:hypothetical protein
LLQDKLDAVADEYEFMILANRLCLHQLNVAPRHGRSMVGKRKNKYWWWMAGALMHETDYCTDQPTHTAKEFQGGIG